ncbi:MAG: MaoC/PaaZ C-terminal domain-containing protein [Chloroflexi bacterium]|nr:MaoC/PaaZ C-terminal domain-containing protein [Chloroflexota bacterium]
MSKIHFEDVEIGDEIDPVRQNVTPRQLVQYAAVSQDFTPIHYNTAYAQGAGHDDIIIHGALKTALLSQMLADWAGDIGALKMLETSYRGIDLAGEISCTGSVTDKRVEDGIGLVDIDVQFRNSEGSITTPGKATVALPKRD